MALWLARLKLPDLNQLRALWLEYLITGCVHARLREASTMMVDLISRMQQGCCTMSERLLYAMFSLG
jgi:hypothetical protein